jgi:hypothetical protein
LAVHAQGKATVKVPLFLISYDESLGIASNTGNALENGPMAGHYPPPPVLAGGSDRRAALLVWSDRMVPPAMEPADSAKTHYRRLLGPTGGSDVTPSV